MRLILTAAAFVLLLSTGVSANEETFGDIQQGDSYAETIQPLRDAGIFFGFPDNTFRGKEPVTRYELAVVVCRMMKYFESSLAAPHSISADSESHRIMLGAIKGPEANAWLSSKHVQLPSEMLYNGSGRATADDVSGLVANAIASLIETASPGFDDDTTQTPDAGKKTTTPAAQQMRGPTVDTASEIETESGH